MRIKSSVRDEYSQIYILRMAGDLSADFNNVLMPRQIGRHFAEDIFKCIFCDENLRILI